MFLLSSFGIHWPKDLWGWTVVLYFLLCWIKALCLFNARPRHRSSLTFIWMGFLCFVKQFLTFIHLHIFILSLSLPAALPFRDAEQRQPGGSDVHGQPQRTPRAQAARSGCTEWWKRTLAAHWEASWQVVCLSVSPKEPYNSAFRPWDGVLVSLRSFAVQVDEEAKREAALPNDQSVNLHRLFLGGVPAEVEQTSNRVNVPFQGCIWNLMINTVYVTLCFHCVKRLELGISLKFLFEFLFRNVFGLITSVNNSNTL